MFQNQIQLLGHDTIEMQVSRLSEGAKVVLVDDLLATGGSSFLDKILSKIYFHSHFQER